MNLHSELTSTLEKMEESGYCIRQKASSPSCDEESLTEALAEAAYMHYHFRKLERCLVWLRTLEQEKRKAGR